jgi:hypothetical protein
MLNVPSGNTAIEIPLARVLRRSFKLLALSSGLDRLTVITQNLYRNPKMGTLSNSYFPIALK